MKKTLLSFLVLSTLALNSYAQAPDGFSYQAVIRDAASTILNSQPVGMRLTIQQGSAGGTAVYTETFATTTNGYGLVNLEIGTGTTVDDFTTIDWANGPYFVETAVDVNGGTNYSVMGTSQLMSVPYALHANTASVALNDPDNDPTNEIQAISMSNDTLYLSNGGQVYLGAYAIDLVDDADNDASNEIQDLQLNGNILTITNNGSATNIDLSTYLDNTDTQLSETQVDAFVANNGYLTTEVDGSTTNEIQDLQLNGNILTITNNGSATNIDLSGYLDNTDTQLSETQVDAFVANNGYLTTEVDGSTTNEIQDLQLNGNILTITNNGSATSIDLSAYLDNTDTQLTEAQVDAFVANNGYLTTEVDGSTTNEIQTISKSGSTVTLSDGGGSVVVHADPQCFDNTNRFVDCGNGTVTDQMTGLIWLQNVNCFGQRNYTNGSDQVAQLAHGQCGLTDNSSPGDWRVPTIEEWQAFMDATCGSPTIPNTAGTGCFTDGPTPFTNMPNQGTRSFHSSDLNPSNLAQYQIANLDNGTTFNFPRATTGFWVWPVRDGK